MEWRDVIDAAESISWVAAIATTGDDGRLAVSFVSPGFGDEMVYVATRPGSRKRPTSSTPACFPPSAFRLPLSAFRLPPDEARSRIDRGQRTAASR